MRYPMAQPALAHIAIVINKYSPAGQVGEHGAGAPPLPALALMTEWCNTIAAFLRQVVFLRRECGTPFHIPTEQPFQVACLLHTGVVD